MLRLLILALVLYGLCSMVLQMVMFTLLHWYTMGGPLWLVLRYWQFAAMSCSCPGALWAVLYGWCPVMPLMIAIARSCPCALWVALYGCGHLMPMKVEMFHYCPSVVCFCSMAGAR